jgi:hypothetical protein
MKRRGRQGLFFYGYSDTFAGDYLILDDFTVNSKKSWINEKVDNYLVINDICYEDKSN